MVQGATWSGTPSIKGSSESMRMFLLTFSLIGLQVTWGIEMTYGTPYLLSLGLTKSRTSLVWLAGPLSGLIMQPIAGAVADRSTSRYGRRRPFMIAGSVAVGICLFMLGWTAEIVQFFLGKTSWTQSITIVLAVFNIYTVDFSINVVQSCCRSLIVDTLPVPQQQLGSAWASRMVAVGHLIGYGAGAIDLEAVFGNAIGDTQFKRLCVIAALVLLTTVGVTCWGVTERILISDNEDAQSGPLFVLMKIFRSTVNLPPRIQGICWVQFWSWIAYFPFLFYGATWVGETWAKFNPEKAAQSKDHLGDIGRIGSTSLIIFSLVVFASSVTIPWLVKSPEDDRRRPRSRGPYSPLTEVTPKSKPSLLAAWFWSHFVFALPMLLTPFVPSLWLATMLIAIVGVPWAIAGWAPFTFIGVEVNKMEAAQDPDRNYLMRRHSPDTAARSSSPDLEAEVHHPGTDGGLAGLYLGILNVYTTLPQFVGTFIATIVFAIFDHENTGDPDPSNSWPNAISVCLFIGALSVLGAAYATRRLMYIL